MLGAVEVGEGGSLGAGVLGWVGGVVVEGGVVVVRGVAGRVGACWMPGEGRWLGNNWLS